MTILRVGLLGLLSVPPALGQVALPEADFALWSDNQREFFTEGPALLLTAEERERIAGLDDARRQNEILSFVSTDPLPSTPLNELAEGIERRRQLARGEFLSPRDVRAQLLFLNGRPVLRDVIECGIVLKPLEIWTFGGTPEQPADLKGGTSVVVYQPQPDAPWRLWVPLDSKRVLYTPEMESFLEQLHQFQGANPRFRLDIRTCRAVKRLDKVTGVKALLGYDKNRPLAESYSRFLDPPRDLAAWAREAAATALPELPGRLAVEDLVVTFPERQSQRTVARARITLPPESGIELATASEEEGGRPELRLLMEGVVELDGEPFDSFRVRFRQTDPSLDTPILLVLDRALRADREYVMRLRLRDEVSLREVDLSAGFRVPREADGSAEEAKPEGVVELLADGRGAVGPDALLLTPPEEDVTVGLWRTEALISGDRIRKVTFFVDGEPQLTRSRPPFGVELRLAQVPREQTVRAEGYDDNGEMVAFDELVVNQVRGAFAVRLVSPVQGFEGSGMVEVRAEVVVPEARRVETVEIRFGDQAVATLTAPPWTAQVEVPPPTEGDLQYVSAVAILDDSRSAEAVRFLNAPDFVEEVDVNLVELYAAVLDRTGRPVQGLQESDFEVFEDGRRQEIRKFEQVISLPLSVGVVVDMSGSMADSIGQAQQAGKDFIEEVLKPGDRCFVMGFADRPDLLMAPSDDAEACLYGLDGLTAIGATALHDAVVSSLYYFRGARGQKALVLLSDGDDSASNISFDIAAEYARRSGVAIYAIGFRVGPLAVNVRQKLGRLAEDTGGRTFYVSTAEELKEVYDQIEDELRSRYLVAFSSDRQSSAGEENEFREVELKVKKRGLKVRTMRGYSP
ncbi:MAG: VWA domain-containing protein [Acidobacteriota bacterium]